MSKVVLDVMTPWIASKIEEYLGVEDEVVVGFVISSLEESNTPDPKRMQINLTGFLEQNAAVFMKELWQHLLSAQASPSGIPDVFLEQAKARILEKKVPQWLFYFAYHVADLDDSYKKRRRCARWHHADRKMALFELGRPDDGFLFFT